MARRRRMGRSGGARRRKVVWDTPSTDLAFGDFPVATITSIVPQDGSYSGIKRYTGQDRTVLRSIGQIRGRVDQSGLQANTALCLELCVGLSYFDSTQDTDGQASLATIGDGAGPLSDADNSRWFIRCCLCIPLGILAKAIQSGDNITEMFPPMGSANPYSAGYSYLGAAEGTEELTWWCNFDTKAKRKIRGLDTPWLNIAMEITSSVAVAAGDDIAVSVDSFQLRQVYAIG